jgi:hypothetical protein
VQDKGVRKHKQGRGTTTRSQQHQAPSTKACKSKAGCLHTLCTIYLRAVDTGRNSWLHTQPEPRPLHKLCAGPAQQAVGCEKGPSRSEAQCCSARLTNQRGTTRCRAVATSQTETAQAAKKATMHTSVGSGGCPQQQPRRHCNAFQWLQCLTRMCVLVAKARAEQNNKHTCRWGGRDAEATC